MYTFRQPGRGAQLGLLTLLLGGCLLATRDRPKTTGGPPAAARQEQAEERDDREPTAALGMAQERYLKRLGPQGTIPLGALLNAKRHADAMPFAVWNSRQPTHGIGVEDAGLSFWTWLGPGNIGGRIRSIAFRNANTILIGAASGGIWRSTNAGTSWTPMTDFVASLEVASLAVDPTNTSIVYAGTGEGFNGAGRPNRSSIIGAPGEIGRAHV